MPTPLQIAQHRWDNASYFDTPEDEPKSPCCNAELIRRRDGSERCVGCDRIFNAMITIYKYPLNLRGSQYIALPWSAQLVHVDEQEGQIAAWVLVDTKSDGTLDREFVVAGTGQDISRYIEDGKQHFKSVVMSNGYVWHVLVSPGLLEQIEVRED